MATAAAGDGEVGERRGAHHLQRRAGGVHTTTERFATMTRQEAGRRAGGGVAGRIPITRLTPSRSGRERVMDSARHRVVQDEGLPGHSCCARGGPRSSLRKSRRNTTARGCRFVLSDDGAFRNPNGPRWRRIDGNPKTGWGLATYNEYRKPMLALRFTQARRRQTTNRRSPSGSTRTRTGGARPSGGSGSVCPRHGIPGPRARARAKAGSRRGRHRPHCQGAAPRAGRRSDDDRKAIAMQFLWSQPELTEAVAEVAQLEGRASILDGRSRAL